MIFKHRIGYVLLPIFLVVLAGCQYPDVLKPEHAAAAQTVQTPVRLTVQDQITNYLLSKHLNGTVAIVKDGQTIYNEGVGYANFKTKAANQSTTTYPIASITKSIVATCVLQLQEKGMLSIYDPVDKYLPGFPNGNHIQLIHLLNHTSGIQSPIQHSQISSLQDLIKGVESRPVKFQPGTEWEYKDENYAILGFIVEKVSGTSLHDYIQKNIFAKAGMKNSGFITKSNPAPFTSTGYMRNANQKLSVKKINNQVLFGFADIYATAYDICLYDTGLMNGKLVSMNSLKEILTPGSASKYGLGLYNYGYAVHSRGVIAGWEALHVYYDDKTAITILLNVRDKSMNIHQVSQDLFSILGAEAPNPRFHQVEIGDAYAQGMLMVK